MERLPFVFVALIVVPLVVFLVAGFAALVLLVAVGGALAAVVGGAVAELGNRLARWGLPPAQRDLLTALWQRTGELWSTQHAWVASSTYDACPDYEPPKRRPRLVLQQEITALRQSCRTAGIASWRVFWGATCPFAAQP